MQKLNPALLPSTWSNIEVHIRESPQYAKVLPLKFLLYVCGAHVTASNLK